MILIVKRGTLDAQSRASQREINAFEPDPERDPNDTICALANLSTCERSQRYHV